MQIYINKNNQQLGPFNEAKVLEMLRNKQLSPADFGIKQGQTDWQKLEVMFPNTNQPAWTSPVNQPQVQLNQAVAPIPKQNSKGTWIALTGCGGLIILSIVGFIAFAFMTRKTPTDVASNVASTNTESTNSSPKPAPTADYKKHYEMLDKKNELFKMSPPQKLVSKPVIKPKVLVIEKTADYDTISPTIESGYSVEKYGIKETDYADNLDELQTLIQIKCVKGKEIGKYGPRMSYTSAYANACTITIIDYKALTVITKKSIINAKRPVTIPDSGDYINEEPFREIEKYVKELPRE